MSNTTPNTRPARLTQPAIYRANRAAGMTASYALDTARHTARVLDVLDSFTAEILYGESLQAVYTTEDTNAGVTLAYEVYRDYDGTPEDAECYSPEDVAAWKNDDWHYYGVSVTATLGRFSVTESLWGIDAGDYWETPARPLDTEQQVMSTALEYFPVRAMVSAVQDRAITKCLQSTPSTNTEG